VDKKEILKKLKSRSKIVGECLIYTGTIGLQGYGKLFIDGKLYKTHRLSCWIYHDLDLDSNLRALHKVECKAKSCWNPEHLYVGNDSDNLYDRYKAGWKHPNTHKTKCPKGHPYAGKNLIVEKRGSRRCRECKNSRRRIGIGA
jgi:hypothetical protein